MPKKCDHCGILFEQRMKINVCQECGGEFCYICTLKALPLTGCLISGFCPVCQKITVPEDEIQEEDNIDQKIDDLKGYDE